MEQKKYSCFVVDDEPIARKIITGYIAQMPILSLAGTCINALECIEFLRAHPAIDIIFLDINMPHLSGMQMLKIIQPQQPVIFTTAYSAHAVESYELNAIDYLLKPFSFDRFTKAVYKAVDAHRKTGKHSDTPPAGVHRNIFIKSDGKNYPVALDDILYCEAMKNYSRIVLKNGMQLMPLIPLSRLEASLAEAGEELLQVHRSFLVSKKHITAFSSNSVTIGKYEIPVGVQFRDRFLKAIGMKDPET